MKLRLEGLKIVLEREEGEQGERDGELIKRVYDKFLEFGGPEIQLLGVPDFWMQVVIQPKRLAEARRVEPGVWDHDNDGGGGGPDSDP